MPDINISHKKIHIGKIHDFSTEIDSEHSIKNIVTDKGFWCSKKSNSVLQDFFIIDYKDEVPVNFIEISTSSSGKTTFPTEFRIEASLDGSGWKNIQTEKSFNLGDLNEYTLYIPLTILRFLKMVIIKPGKVGTKYFSEIGRFQAGIAGIKEVTSSSSSSYKNDPSKLFDMNKETYWESNINQKKGKETIKIDLGNIFQINRLSLSSTDSTEHAFPEDFIVSISKDNELWTSLFDERNFIAESSKKYYWDNNPIECRFIHINMDNVKINKNSYTVRLSEIEIFGTVTDFSHTHNIGELVSNASIFQYGLVKLAKNGEETADAVVQSSDTRLKNASNLSKGIVQLADDGDDKANTAVQASDTRLKKASELRYGIVRLAKDREENPDVVVKSNDSRLKKATISDYGIVKICKDREYSEFGVVLGNDSRLDKASTDSFGIVRLAGNAEVNPNCVVQGNDKRLRDATTNYKGIVELAENGE
ncbi:MAG: discoidin domain-containing protein, partial [Spirochaetes bacterium]|nr:discoidin domain-containing protein [Spirochaetota bacterium]